MKDQIQNDCLAFRLALLEWDAQCNERYGESRRSAKQAFYASKNLENVLLGKSSVKVLRIVKVG